MTWGDWMPKYSVQIPLTGSIIVTVEAPSPQAAKSAAWDLADFTVVPVHPDYAEACDCDLHETVTDGNVLHAACNEINVEEIE